MFKPWLWNNWIFYVFNSLGRQRASAIKTVHDFTLKVKETFLYSEYLFEYSLEAPYYT